MQGRLVTKWLVRFMPTKNRKTRPIKQGTVDMNEPLMKASKCAGILLNRRGLFLMGLLSSQLFLNACATENYMFHSFSFSAVSESPDIEVLDYQYGSKSEYEREGGVGLRAAPYRLERGDIFTGVGITGTFPRGDYLYVKWRIKNTGQIYEDKVDLTNRLPKDITQHEIHFLINGTQLFVFLLPPPYKFSMFDYRKNDAANITYFKKHQIYPN